MRAYAEWGPLLAVLIRLVGGLSNRVASIKTASVNRSTRVIGQLAVVIPTVALSAFLGAQGVPPRPRLFFSLGFGLVLIMVIALWQRRMRK
jgi:hypothetical protein